MLYKYGNDENAMRDREHTSNEQLVPCDIPERITVALNCTAAVAAAAANNNKYKSEMKHTKKMQQKMTE